MNHPMSRLAASIIERELALSEPIVPKGQEHYDVWHLHKGEWIRFAYCCRLEGARALAGAVRGICATWIRPHDRNGPGVIPAGAATA